MRQLKSRSAAFFGVTDNEENKIYLLKEAHLRQPNGEFEHSVILVLAGTVVIDDI